MTFILNVIWFLIAGWALGLSWLLAAVVACLTIVLTPYAPACLRLAGFTAAPFGKEVIERSVGADLAGETVRAGLNIIWLVFGGWWLWLFHILWGIGLCITLIGIPFALQAFKIAGAAAWPVGRDVVPKR